MKNKNGENIGKIEDIMIDWRSGGVAYTVLAFGGILGFGNKLFAVPLQRLEFRSDGDKEWAIFDVEKQRLEDAPGFERNRWPQQIDAFVDKVYSHYQMRPFLHTVETV